MKRSPSGSKAEEGDPAYKASANEHQPLLPLSGSDSDNHLELEASVVQSVQSWTESKWFIRSNLFYSGWSAGVFALLSFFRAEGENDFKRIGDAKDSVVGVLYSLSSFGINVPMAFLFSYTLIATFRRFFNPNSIDKNGNWYLTVLTVAAIILGGGTTFAGVALSNSSLAWMPGYFKWFADATTAVFAWNTFTTRTKSVLDVFHTAARKVVEKVVRILHRHEEEHEAFFLLLGDVERFENVIGDLEFKKSANPSLKFTALADVFYESLVKKQISEAYTCSEWSVWAATTGASLTLSTIAFTSLVLWLGLTEKGLDIMADWCGGSEWGKISSLTWWFALSHLFLYIRSAWNVPQLVAEIYHRPALKKYFENSRHADLKKAAVVFTLFAVFCGLIGTPSGAGYARTADIMIDNGFESVAEDWLHSNNFLARIYQALFALFKPQFSNLFFPMAGSIVNGSSALRCYLGKGDDWLLKKLLPVCLFSKENKKNVISCSVGLEELRGCLLRHDYDTIFNLGFLQKIKDSREQWVNRSRSGFSADTKTDTTSVMTESSDNQSLQGGCNGEAYHR